MVEVLDFLASAVEMAATGKGYLDAEAAMTKQEERGRIEEFQGEYRFLSNFYPCAVKFDGQFYPTVEHAYQAAKTYDKAAQNVIRQAEKPGQAKRLGRRVTLRPDWERVKESVMIGLLRQKFSEPVLQKRLLATGQRELIEGNDWNDTYWGVCRGRGENKLGKLLMEVRKELQP